MKPTDLRPPFDLAIATQKVRMAENAWNTRDPEKVSLAYTENSVWRNRSEHFEGRASIVEFLTRKWQRELDYRLIKELWAFPITGSGSVFSMNGMIKMISGIDHTEMTSGNSLF